jgi:nitroreductase
MDLEEAIRHRRSIRKYQSKDVEPEKIETVLEAARWAPSASNKQPWHFIVVRDAATRRILGETHSHGRFLKESPVVIVVLSYPDKHPRYHLADPHIAVQNLLLTAYSLGLGTCWAGVRDTDFESKFREILDVPKDVRVICAVAMGYPNEVRESNRVPLSEIVSWEKYGQHS